MNKILLTLLTAASLIHTALISADSLGQYNWSKEKEEKISGHYQQVLLKKILKNDAIKEKQKSDLILQNLNNLAICIGQRTYLYSDKAMSPDDQEKYKREAAQLNQHYSAFTRALTALGDSKAQTILDAKLRNELPDIIKVISAVYGRNKNSGKSQVTDELLSLARRCNNKLSETGKIEIRSE